MVGTGPDAGQGTADTLAGGGGVGQGLFQPVLGQLIPFGDSNPTVTGTFSFRGTYRSEDGSAA